MEENPSPRKILGYPSSFSHVSFGVTEDSAKKLEEARKSFSNALAKKSHPISDNLTQSVGRPLILQSEVSNSNEARLTSTSNKRDQKKSGCPEGHSQIREERQPRPIHEHPCIHTSYLTEEERSFLSNILVSCDDPMMVQHVSDRQSDTGLFPPPSNTSSNLDSVLSNAVLKHNTKRVRWDIRSTIETPGISQCKSSLQNSDEDSVHLPHNDTVLKALNTGQGFGIVDKIKVNDRPHEKTTTKRNPYKNSSIMNINDFKTYRDSLENVELFSSLQFKVMGIDSITIPPKQIILNPSLMEDLRSFLPEPLRDNCNFWLRYATAKKCNNGGCNHRSLYNLLQQCRASKHTLLVIHAQPTNAHNSHDSSAKSPRIFGCYTNSQWRPQWGFFGSSSSHAFVWRSTNRDKSGDGLDVYPFTGNNSSVQMCRADKLGIGGGAIASLEHKDSSTPMKCTLSPHCTKTSLNQGEHHGFAISLDADLLHGSTSQSETFDNPCLIDDHATGSIFRIINLEAWSLTMHDTVEEAEDEESASVFLDSSNNSSRYNEPIQKRLSLVEIWRGYA